MIQTVSGAHFNPAVTLGFWRIGAMSGAQASRHVTAQILGGVLGVLAASMSFGQAIASVSSIARSGLGLTFAETVATFVLVLPILGLGRKGRPGAVPAAVAAWVACVVFATSSTGFANPAVTVSRVLTDSYTSIAPASAPGFLIAQIVAGVLAAVVAASFYPEHMHQQATT